MVRSTEALVEPDILKWARSTAGFSIDEAAARLQTQPERLTAWEAGDQSPSMSQLRKMANAYRRMLSDFYLPTVPTEDALPHDFRRLPGEVAFRYSRGLRYQLRLARQRRELAIDLAGELEADIPTFTGKLSMNNDPEGTGAELRRLLGVSLDVQRTWRDPRLSYNGWRGALEQAGILVFQADGIDTSEMLGFSLSERPLPVIGVNLKLKPNGRTFTLLHECVHVMLQQSSICDIEEGVLRPPEEQRVEVFCNAAAAATLVPRDALLAEPLVAMYSAGPRDWTEDELGAIARGFGVSNEVVLRRLLTAGRTSRAFYMQRRAFWGSLMSSSAPTPEPPSDYKRNMPQEAVSNLGKPLTRLVLESFDSSYTSLADASRYLGVRAEQVARVRQLLAKG